MKIPTPACQQRWEQRLWFGAGILPILTGEHCSSRASRNNYTNPKVNSPIPSNTMSLRITFGKTILSIYIQIHGFPELNIMSRVYSPNCWDKDKTNKSSLTLKVTEGSDIIFLINVIGNKKWMKSNKHNCTRIPKTKYGKIGIPEF